MIPIGIAVVGMLAAMVIPAVSKARHRAQQHQVVPAPQTHTNLAFGPVVERTINRASTGTNFLLNFKTGELRTPPPESGSSASGHWPLGSARGTRCGSRHPQRDNDVMTGFDMAAVPAPAQCWEELTPAAAAARLEVEPPSSSR